VKRGSFAIAGTVAGFYTIDTPGGWNILGRTDVRLDIAPGDEIVIHPTEREMGLPPVIETAPPPDIGATFSGNFATVVTKPFDPELAAYANRLVGNHGDAPILECAMVGPKARLEQRSVVAWAGAESEISGVFEAEEEINVGRIRNGLRGWLAIGSEIRDAEPPIRTDRLNIGVLPGPHQSPIRTVECEVTPQLNRVGIRLKPLTPLNGAPSDLPSCGMQFGTIQLHPDGSLVAMGPDHPITGGYLQPLTVLWDERWKLAQLTPGERVVFRVD
jgi:allophanate hydrolase subunit 2